MSKQESAGGGSLFAEPDWDNPQVQAIAKALGRVDHSQDQGEIDPELAVILAPADTDLRITLVRLVRVFAKVRFILPVFPHRPAKDQKRCPPGALTQVPISSRRNLGISQTTSFESESVVPVYSDLEAFEQAAYDGARPVPVNGRGLALLALESSGRILLNDKFLLGKPALTAIGTGGEWLPAWENQEILRIVEEYLKKNCAPKARETSRMDGTQDYAAGLESFRVLGILPQLAGADRLVIQVFNRSEEVIEALNGLSVYLEKHPLIQTQTDLLAITPIPGTTYQVNE